MKNKIKKQLYFAPPSSIKTNLQEKLFPKQGFAHWKLLFTSITACCLLALMTYQYLNVPAIDESYVESFFMAEEMLDEGLGEYTDEYTTATEQEDESTEALI
ncbi:MAG: hypothetical protein A2X86_08605 [Bdellovibrionales bacterium GWA2_49_15]|nr:MAG: hypothetical protein A2X86_08605 [Bdellovibrionales bacterium GWA2_49_15]HAZ11177.1 hypothetical protein [Bdellovibrionales bacterium]